MVHKTLHDVLFAPLLTLYSLIQWFLGKVFSPSPPPPNAQLGRPKIAVIGAGLTGVSAASHCVGHGFDVVIFEQGGKDAVGGIWTKVNNTSGLQISSIMYRFHPSIDWSKSYPKRNEIVSQVTSLWERYGLEKKTKFNTKVEKVYKDPKGRWIINNPSEGRFDGIIAAVGSCGQPKRPHIHGQEKFSGEIYHSSELDGKNVEGKNVLIVGGGASAVEALEFCDNQQAGKIFVLARSEKWIIPRNPIVDSLLAMNIFGQETVLSWIPENLLRIFFYRDLRDIAPPKGFDEGLFTGTPMVNSRIFELVRRGKAEWLRGDILDYDESGRGINFNKRAQGSPKNGPGHQQLIEGDVVIMSTGYSRPSLSFLPSTFFAEPYAPPNWYMTAFPPEDATVCCNNCNFVSAIGSVGNWHIGIWTRFLLMFLVDPLTRPTESLMKRWIDTTRWIKSAAPGGAFDFFTYAELVYWFVFVIVFNPFRWKWALFVLCGIGANLPLKVVEEEDRFREGGHKRDGEMGVNGH